MCLKPYFKEIVLKLSTNGQSDKGFLLTSTFVHKGLSAPVLALYICIKALKYIYQDQVSGERLQDHCSSGCSEVKEGVSAIRRFDWLREYIRHTGITLVFVGLPVPT